MRSDGELVTAEGRFAYTTVEEYATLLAEDPQVQRCITQHALEFAVGEPIEEPNQPALQAVHDNFVAAGGTYAALLQAITSHPIFSTIITE